MRNTLPLAAIALLAALIPGACKFTTPQTHYYILTPRPAPSTAPAAPLRIGLETLQASTIYAHARIAYRSSAHEIGFYHYRQWAVPPDLLISDAILESMRGINRFAAVVRAPTRETLDFSVSGRLLEIYEDQRDENWAAALSIEWTIRDGRTDQALKRFQTTQRAPIDGQTTDDLARAMTRAAEATATQLADAIAEAAEARSGINTGATEE